MPSTAPASAEAGHGNPTAVYQHLLASHTTVEARLALADAPAGALPGWVRAALIAPTADPAVRRMMARRHDLTADEFTTLLGDRAPLVANRLGRNAALSAHQHIALLRSIVTAGVAAPAKRQRAEMALDGLIANRGLSVQAAAAVCAALHGPLREYRSWMAGVVDRLARASAEAWGTVDPADFAVLVAEVSEPALRRRLGKLRAPTPASPPADGEPRPRR